MLIKCSQRLLKEFRQKAAAHYELKKQKNCNRSVCRKMLIMLLKYVIIRLWIKKGGRNYGKGKVCQRKQWS